DRAHLTFRNPNTTHQDYSKKIKSIKILFGKKKTNEYDLKKNSEKIIMKTEKMIKKIKHTGHMD
ncbi:hypothetical protein JVW17_20385, partial [Vibrio cholerae O1]|uniref:hypothetical protein n=1 Tax=Vibrio cholerae TaxID=666 RepID=UPI001C128A42